LVAIWLRPTTNGGETSKEETPNLNAINGKPKQDLSCDEILAIYLKEISQKTTKDYFHFMMKFVLLFRECINRIKMEIVEENKKTDEKTDFSQLYSAESAPDTCNEFITEFMEPNDYFGLDTGELIEVIQHLCYWLYVSNYTTSRLTLL